MMKLLIISGRSGSGKSICLRLLEDMGYYCVDNLPIGLLDELKSHIRQPQYEQIAVSIDARNIPTDLNYTESLLALKNKGWEVLYFDAKDSTLLQRFSETRRKHPLTNKNISLNEAIIKEKILLEPLANAAELMIDTSHMTTHQLQVLLRDRVVQRPDETLSILFQSFGYKHGIPADADFVFDVRCLPNPYWHADLRAFTGLDTNVMAYLQSQDSVNQMYKDIKHFLDIWIPQFQADNRSYLTVAIGCTGGQHRSVYLCEQLARDCHHEHVYIQTRHRELST